MKMKKQNVVIAVLAAVVAALVWLNVNVKVGVEPDAVYPMVNARIEWTGAGYSGIYGR